MANATIEHVSFILKAQAPVVNRANKPCYFEISTIAAGQSGMHTATIEVQPGFAAEQLAQQVYDALADNLDKPFNIHPGIALRRVMVTTHAKREDVCDETCLLYVDIDKNITRENLAERLAKLPVQPSMVIFSGHGVHLYFRLSAPISTKVAEIINKALAQLVNGDMTTFNRNRILRLAGSKNWKDPENPVLVEILDEHSSGNTYPPSLFDGFGKEADEEQIQEYEVDENTEAVFQKAIAQSPDFLVLEPLVAQLSERIQSIVFHAIDPKAPKKDDRSALIQSAITSMAGAGWTDEKIMQVMTCDAFQISERLLKEGITTRDTAKYLTSCIAKARDYVEKNGGKKKSKKDSGQGAETSISDNTGSAKGKVQAILAAARKSDADPHDRCVEIIQKELAGQGEFIYCSDGFDSYDLIAPRDRCYYRDDKNRIIPIADEQFDTMLRLHYGLPGTQGTHKSIRELLIDHIAEHYTEYQQVEFANIGQHKNGAFYMAQGHGQILKVTPGNIETIPNGTDGVFFKSEVQPWQYVPSQQGNYLDEIFQASVDPKAPYTEIQAKLALKTWMIANYLRGEEMIIHHAILNLIGAKGSGKSTLIQNMVRVMLGNPQYTAGGLPRDERNFITSVRDRGIVVFDNVEGYKFGWNFEDHLARVYQSGTHEERKLFKDAVQLRYKPNTFLCLTAIKPGWGRSDVADRSIVIELDTWATHRGTNSTTQQKHLANLIAHRNEILTEVAKSLQKLLVHLQEHDLEEYRINHRLESYPMAVNAWCVANDLATMNELNAFWVALQEAQDDLTNIDTLTVDLFEKFVIDLIKEPTTVMKTFKKTMLVSTPRIRPEQSHRVAIKPDDIYEYLLNAYPLTQKAYTSNRHFKSAIMEHKDTLLKKGIMVSADKDNKNRFWVIDYREYLNDNAVELGIVASMNDAKNAMEGNTTEQPSAEPQVDERKALVRLQMGQISREEYERVIMFGQKTIKKQAQ